MRMMCVTALLILILGSSLTVLLRHSMAEDTIPFENDTRETATVLEMETIEDSISMMDYYDYYIIEKELIDEYSILYLTITFIDVPGSGFIEMRTFIEEYERDYAYLNRENKTKSIAFDSNKTLHKDLYVELILTPAEAYSGGLYTLEVPVHEVCPVCGGSGFHDLLTCPECRG
ncbi:MAG: hypothetical protein ACMUHY_09540, partial [Thermoplasmatota archaeon]